MSWDAWLRAWGLHAKTDAFKRRHDRAVDVAQRGARHGRMYCSLSGGKDSAALAGIVDEAGLSATVPSVHAHTKLDLPDTLNVVHAIAERLDLDLHVIEPDGLELHVQRIAKKYRSTPPQPGVSGYDEFDLLRAIPEGVDIIDALGDVRRALAAANMLVSHMYEAGYDGAYVGIRADESHGRREYARRWGYEHQFKADDTHNVCPLLAWTGEDVYAYLVSREIPIHPYYRAAFEAYGGTERDPAKIRVDIALPPVFPASKGALALFARVYPAAWQQLVSIRPELMHYVA